MITSSADLGYTATELLELPPDELPYFLRPEDHGEAFGFLAYVKPWEDFDDLKRFARGMHGTTSKWISNYAIGV